MASFSRLVESRNGFARLRLSGSRGSLEKCVSLESSQSYPVGPPKGGELVTLGMPRVPGHRCLRSLCRAPLALQLRTHQACRASRVCFHCAASRQCSRGRRLRVLGPQLLSHRLANAWSCCIWRRSLSAPGERTLRVLRFAQRMFRRRGIVVFVWTIHQLVEQNQIEDGSSDPPMGRLNCR